MSSLNNVIEVKNAMIYHGENLILSAVNFNVKQGEFIYLVGKVGSGKSSLIKTLNAELRLKKGEAWVAGYKLHQIKDVHIPFLRRKVGVVFQDFQLLTDRTVKDNLLFALKATGWVDKAQIEKRILTVLEKVNLLDKTHQMPHQLSGGEQQRVVIARALLNEPEIILADEPTGNLDPETSENIMMVLHEISANGQSIIMATHNYGLLQRFPKRVIRCEQGRLSELANSNEVDLSLLV
ncbi:MAG: cell division ATP-binding protein FtsE [Bacteroidales bacterium]